MTLLDMIGRAPPKPWWREHWRRMPEFVQEDKPKYATLDVHFRDEKDHRAFRRRIAAYGRCSGKASQRVKPFINFNDLEAHRRSRRVWIDGGEPILPLYPIYIVSKGRAEGQLTSRALNAMRVDHYVVVERQELERYARHKLPRATLLVLDPRYQQDYDACDQLGMTKSKGAGPARNFAWDHAIAHGYAWHWVMDDNIQSFYRLGRNRKFLVKCGAIFRAMETFCERYANVSMAGPQYEMFAKSQDQYPAFIANTRIYSCNLIRNDIPYRWRGRYNEDTDLSLRILKGGNCTVEFVAFLQNKLGTQRLAGGNTAEFYAEEGTGPKSQMLYDLHSDVTQLVTRFSRPHHRVDYTPFAKNELRFKPGVVLPDEPDEFGMVQVPFVRRRYTAQSVSRHRRQFVRPEEMPRLHESRALLVHFDSQADVETLTRITGLQIKRNADEVWFPRPIDQTGGLLRYVSTAP
jgi:TET-associated glycosyltransferase-like protein